MCGVIQKATSSEQALEFSLAYATHEYGRPHPEYDGPNEVADRREAAKHFISYWVPADYRVGAIHLLAQRADNNLATDVQWDGGVVI